MRSFTNGWRTIKLKIKKCNDNQLYYIFFIYIIIITKIYFNIYIVDPYVRYQLNVKWTKMTKYMATTSQMCNSSFNICDRKLCFFFHSLIFHVFYANKNNYCLHTKSYMLFYPSLKIKIKTRKKTKTILLDKSHKKNQHFWLGFVNKQNIIF